MKKVVNVNLKSFLALILVSILMLSVASPVLAGDTYKHEYTEKELEYEKNHPIAGGVLDFSNLEEGKIESGATSVRGDQVTGSYSAKKEGTNYTITLENVTAKKIILPYDDADAEGYETKDKDGKTYNIKPAVKRDAQGNPVPRTTHITIELKGINEVNGYGIEGHYVKGVTIKGPGSLKVVTHLEDKKDENGETTYYIVPGISVETDSIEDKDGEENTGFVLEGTKVTVTNPYYWGIICNGDMELKNGSKLTVNSYSGIQKRADAGDISTDKLFVDETSSVNASKIKKFKAEEQAKQEIARERAKYKDDIVKPEIKLKSADGSDLKGTTLNKGTKNEIQIYCEQPTVTVTDDRKIDKVTVNGETITVFTKNTDNEKTFVVPGYLDCEKTVKVTDMNGNEAELKFRSNSNHISSAIALNRKNATCTETGYEEDEFHCLICSEKLGIEKVTLPALGHSYKISNYSSYTKEECTRCGHIEIIEVKKAETRESTSKASSAPQEPQVEKTPEVADSTLTQKSAPASTPEPAATPKAEVKQEPKKEVKKVQVANKITASNFTKKYSSKAQSFSINAKRNGNAKLTYKSNNSNINVDKNSGKVTIKAKYVGKATITISSAATEKYKAATKTITVTVNPSSVKLSKLTNKKSKKMVIKWAKNTTVTGYQIQYSTDKNFKKNVKTVTVSKNKTVSKTVSKLSKNKKYYVRVRTYKTVSKVKYYSSWSNVKNIKIKK